MSIDFMRKTLFCFFVSDVMRIKNKKISIFSAQDDHGIIKPDVVFYRRPSTSLSQFSELTIDHKDSNYALYYSMKRWSSDSGSIIDDEETVDATSSTFEKITKTTASNPTPIRPLSPAYHSLEPIQLSTIRILPYNNSETEMDCSLPGFIRIQK